MGMFAVMFGIVWTIAASEVGFFAIFGVFFIIAALVTTFFHFKNAMSKNRYSVYDIVDHDDEPDPFNQRSAQSSYRHPSFSNRKYCPFCETPVGENHKFCHQCGSRLP